MSALAQLAECLGLSSDPQTAPATPPIQPAANDPHQKTRGQLDAPARPIAPATREPKRTAWKITRAGQPLGYMVGQPMTYSEAIAAVRWRWPDAELDGAPKEPNP